MATEASASASAVSTATPDAPVAEAPKSDAAAAPTTGDADAAAPTPDAPVKDVANGDQQKETEVNGHDEVSPKTLVPESKTDSLPTPKDEPLLEEAQATPAEKKEKPPKPAEEPSKEGEGKSDEKVAQKEGEEKAAPVEEEKKVEEPAKPEESAKDESKDESGDKMEIDAPEVPAGDAPKEPIASPAVEKAPEQPTAAAAEEKSQEEDKAAATTDAKEANEDKAAEQKTDAATEEVKSDEAKEKEAPAPSTTETPTTAEPTSKPPASPAKPQEEGKQQEDVEMADAPPAAVEPPARSEEPKPAEATPPATQQETQDTTISDVPPPTPAVADKKKEEDAPKPSPAAPVTADTSMSDAPPPSSSSKPYREREEDSEDEPVAKRAKVSPAADQANVKNEAVKREDRMDIDSKPAASSASTPNPADRNANATLADDSINQLPISDYMNRQIRQVLAGVKKTKAGFHFRLPVSELWPGLWNEYSAKVKDPTDIQTMEKRLRGNLAKYQTVGDFKRDLDKLVANSILFNGEAHDVTYAAKSCRDTILARLGACPAFEPARPEKKDFSKQHPTRHAEPRAAAHHSSPSAPLPQRPQQPRVNTAAAPAPPSSKPIESPAFAIPANNNGMPLIRRDSTKPDSRAKRPVKPTHSKDLVYDTKRKKKLSPELRFCEEVLTELRKQRYYEFNEAFQKPVDPVALNIPTYHKIIKKPMDLSTMQSKLNAGDYANAKEFERDFDLIIKNCRLFNGEQHIVYEQALRLQNLYRREMSKKDDWLAKHAPPPAPAHHSSNTSPRMKDESDWDEPESEGEPEVVDEELKGAQQRLASYMKRLEEEQKKINDIMLEMNPNMADVEIAQSVVAMLQKQIIAERSKIASMQPTKKAAPAKSHHAKPAASKPKKAMPSGGGSSHHASGSVSKKASGGHSGMGGHGGGMGGMPKKAAARKPAPKRKMGTVEKEVIAAGIADLEGSQLERAIEIIKNDTGTGENDSGELELDIDQLSQEALTQLYDLAIKAFPNLQREKERTMAAQAAPAPPPPGPARAKPVQKTKKNKPMSKMEQERRLQQLNELRAQAGRQGSGSQEPLESIEGTGRASVDPAPQHHRQEDSEDEESSEEE
ncbi:hypothetical protein B0T20DRAFT_355967 [Sordaria brevicollis]|uniref:Bromodomain-containing protein n=1 Tax=Sordaria brevicollis TaxID=83679 RepID=A0AAE0PBL2_SORBR|nr:hypothetical protein B0T20DRAFT_355967 [Sordaria brevicollis]